MAMGRILREVGVSPSFRKAIRRPPRNQGRTSGGSPPEKRREARPYSASAPRPGMKVEGVAPGSSGLEEGREEEDRYRYAHPTCS